MIESISLHGTVVPYELRVNARARRVRVVVRQNGSVYLTVPRERYVKEGKALMEKHAEWILRTVERNKQNPKLGGPTYTRRHYLAHKEAARALIEGRVEYFNSMYAYRFGRISIRNQKGRWGSCSRKGNLNFNYRLLFLPSHLCDYIVVHELCHLKEMNHSPRFWALVAKTFPHYRQLRRELAKVGLTLS